MAKMILVAEDFAHDVVCLRQALSRVGVANPVHVLNDGQAVLAYLKGENVFSERGKFPLPEVLFLDLTMPDDDGFEILEWLKNEPQFDKMLVVMTTGTFDTIAATRAYRLGADSFITKPCSQRDIENLIEYFPEYWVTARKGR